MSARPITHHDDDSLPDTQGCINLVTAFWDQVRAELALWYPELDEHLDLAHRDLARAVAGNAAQRLLTKAQNRAYRFEARWKAIRGTVRWIEREPGFLAWCGMSGAAPDAVRAHLREQYPGPFALFGGEVSDGDPRPRPDPEMTTDNRAARRGETEPGIARYSY